MGTIIDHAIIVSGDRISVAKAHAKAVKIFPEVTSVANAMNGSGAFLVPPDGSKLGWPGSELGCRRRHEFKEWLRAERLSLLEWLEVRYGEIEGNPGVVAGSGVFSDESPASGEWLPDEPIVVPVPVPGPGIARNPTK